jgi:hypothetical protein
VKVATNYTWFTDHKLTSLDIAIHTEPICPSSTSDKPTFLI